MVETFQGITSFFLKGGPFMWPLLVCSVVAVTTIILRTIALREKNVLPLVVESELERLVPEGIRNAWGEWCIMIHLRSLALSG